MVASLRRISRFDEEDQIFGFDGAKSLNFGDKDHYKAMRAMLDSEGLECTTIAGLSPEQSIISPDANTRRAGLEHLKWAVDMSVEMGSPVIVLFTLPTSFC